MPKIGVLTPLVASIFLCGPVGAQEVANHGAGLRLPSDIVKQMLAMKEIQVAQKANIAPQSPLGVVLGAARESALNLGCSESEPIWQWEDKGVFGDVLDQGTCDSCFVYAPLGVVQASWVITRNGDAGGPKIEISEEQQLTCARGNCAGGGDPADVFKFLKKKGGDPAHTVPGNFAKKLPSCVVSAAPPYRVFDWNYVKPASSPRTRPTILGIKQAVCAHGPVVAAIWANNALIHFRGDSVFLETDSNVPHFGDAHPSNSIVNHAVIITGWDENKRAWRVRNSWGTNFGTNGYAWIKYGANNIGEVTYWAEAMPPSATQANFAELKSVDATIRANVSVNARKILSGIWK
jgi:hypothetical protein